MPVSSFWNGIGAIFLSPHSQTQELEPFTRKLANEFEQLFVTHRYSQAFHAAKETKNYGILFLQLPDREDPELPLAAICRELLRPFERSGWPAACVIVGSLPHSEVYDGEIIDFFLTKSVLMRIDPSLPGDWSQALRRAYFKKLTTDSFSDSTTQLIEAFLSDPRSLGQKRLRERLLHYLVGTPLSSDLSVQQWISLLWMPLYRAIEKQNPDVLRLLPSISPPPSDVLQMLDGLEQHYPHPAPIFGPANSPHDSLWGHGLQEVYPQILNDCIALDGSVDQEAA